MNIQEFSNLIHYYPNQDVYFKNCSLELLTNQTIIIRKNTSNKKQKSFKSFLHYLKKKNIKIYDIKRIVTSVNDNIVRSVSKNDLKINFTSKDTFIISLREKSISQ